MTVIAVSRKWDVFELLYGQTFPGINVLSGAEGK